MWNPKLGTTQIKEQTHPEADSLISLCPQKYSDCVLSILIPSTLNIEERYSKFRMNVYQAYSTIHLINPQLFIKEPIEPQMNEKKKKLAIEEPLK